MSKATAGSLIIDDIEDDTNWEAEGLLLRRRVYLESTALTTIRRHLQASLAELEAVLGTSAQMRELVQEVAALETTYG